LAGKIPWLSPINIKLMKFRLTNPLLAITAAIVIAMPAPAQNNRPIDVADFKQPVKLACVGDSITRGVGAKISWPDQIAAMLGDRWKVENFGVSGATLMSSGDKPYQKLEAFNSAIHSAPDVVVIMLGTNDTKPQNWKHFASDYEKDYRGMIAKFAGLENKPRIYLCHPPYWALEPLADAPDPVRRPLCRGQ
jgi:lysophospholipase L1-like esterase